jgi:hypothetical protein
MFGKKVNLARFAYEGDIDPEVFATCKFHPISEPTQAASIGFHKPEHAADGELWFRSADNRFIFAAMRIDERRIPGAIKKEAMEQKKKEFLEQTGFETVPRKEKQELEEQVMLELLPQTLPTPETVNVVFDTKRRMVYLDTSKTASIDSFFALFRATHPDGQHLYRMDGQRIAGTTDRSPESLARGFMEHLLLKGVSVDLRVDDVEDMTIHGYVHEKVVFVNAEETRYNITGYFDMEKMRENWTSVNEVKQAHICFTSADERHAHSFTTDHTLICKGVTMMPVDECPTPYDMYDLRALQIAVFYEIFDAVFMEYFEEAAHASGAV